MTAHDDKCGEESQEAVKYVTDFFREHNYYPSLTQAFEAGASTRSHEREITPHCIPMAWMNNEGHISAARGGGYDTPLYAHPASVTSTTARKSELVHVIERGGNPATYYTGGDHKFSEDFSKAIYFSTRGEAEQKMKDPALDVYMASARIEEHILCVGPAPSPLGDIEGVLAEYDGIVGSMDYRDAEADFVIRGSDWRVIRKAIVCTASATACRDSEAFTVLGLVEWLQRWWKRDAVWRESQQAQLGPDVAHLMRGVANMIEQNNSPDGGEQT